MTDNTEKDKGGRPRKELSDEDFERLVGMIKIQCTQDEICGIFDMTAETLNTRLQERGEESFSTLYKKHQDDGKKSLRRAQWATALSGNPTMLVWLGKQVLGQSDKREVDLGNKDGSLRPRPLDLTKLPPAALEAIVAAADEQSSDD